jgi:hypothetical protein
MPRETEHYFQELANIFFSGCLICANQVVSGMFSDSPSTDDSEQCSHARRSLLHIHSLHHGSNMFTDRNVLWKWH